MDLPEALLPTEPDLRAEATKSWRTGMQELDARLEGPGSGGAQRAGDSRAFGVEPLQFVPDLPGPDGGEARALTDDELDQLAMPTFDGIGHTAAWFERVRRSCPDHAEILLRPRRRVLTDVRRRAQPRAIIRSVSASRRASARNMLIAI